jgi:hypothetical protein
MIEIFPSTIRYPVYIYTDLELLPPYQFIHRRQISVTPPHQHSNQRVTLNKYRFESSLCVIDLIRQLHYKGAHYAIVQPYK